MYRGIIFDMDGVLADTESYYTNRRDEYLRLMGYQRQENTDFTGSNEKALWETMVPNDPELRQELLMGYRAYRKLHPIPFRELLDPQAALLFRALKELRMTLARKYGVPPFVVFTDTALREMSAQKPRDMQGFGRITGVGEVKSQRYGKAFLEVIAEYL